MPAYFYRGHFIDNQVPPQPVPGGATFQFALKRAGSQDGTDLTTLAQNTIPITNEGNGFYSFTLPDGLLLPGERFVFVWKNVTGPDVGFLDAIFSVADPPSVTPPLSGVVEVIMDVGARDPALVYQLTDAAGAPLDLSSGSPVVTFFMAPAAGGALVVNGAATAIVDAPTAKVSYPWGANDSAAPGNFVAWFKLVKNGLVSIHPVGSSVLVRVIAVPP